GPRHGHARGRTSDEHGNRAGCRFRIRIVAAARAEYRSVSVTDLRGAAGPQRFSLRLRNRPWLYARCSDTDVYASVEIPALTRASLGAIKRKVQAGVGILHQARGRIMGRIRPAIASFDTFVVAVKLRRSQLAPSVTVAQQTLDLFVGVRIPGGQ